MLKTDREKVKSGITYTDLFYGFVETNLLSISSPMLIIVLIIKLFWSGKSAGINVN